MVSLLPLELIVEILSIAIVDLDDMKNMNLVDRQWNSVIGNPILWKMLLGKTPFFALIKNKKDVFKIMGHCSQPSIYPYHVPIELMSDVDQLLDIVSLMDIVHTRRFVFRKIPSDFMMNLGLIKKDTNTTQRLWTLEFQKNITMVDEDSDPQIHIKFNNPENYFWIFLFLMTCVHQDNTGIQEIAMRHVTLIDKQMDGFLNK